ncbi:MAG: ABC transporter permease [Thermomicrobiales bacterium]
MVAIVWPEWFRLTDLASVGAGRVPTATLMRIVRVSVADVARADYVRTANAKGLPVRTVLWRHIARNALLPAIAYAGLVGGFLVAGAIAVEVVFAWPGIGQLAMQSVASRDLPVIQAFVAVVAVLIVLANLAADAVALAVDPRLREAAVSGHSNDAHQCHAAGVRAIRRSRRGGRTQAEARCRAIRREPGLDSRSLRC